MSSESVHPAELAPERLLRECEVSRGRRSGPGGQHRNKVETAIVIKHVPTGVVGEASERRSQEQNRRAAIARLRSKLALLVRFPRPLGGSPSDLWQSRAAGGRISVRRTHPDFPALLAEALDVLEANELDIKRSAEQLGVTPSQLVKFLACEPQAMQQINADRRGRGLRPLRFR